MGVYVDNAQLGYGRMKMSHMMADTTAELVSMADRIGVARRWIQYAGTAREHFDICASKRELAIEAGASEVTSRDLVAVMRRKRPTSTPATTPGGPSITPTPTGGER